MSDVKMICVVYTKLIPFVNRVHTQNSINITLQSVIIADNYWLPIHIHHRETNMQFQKRDVYHKFNSSDGCSNGFMQCVYYNSLFFSF